MGKIKKILVIIILIFVAIILFLSFKHIILSPLVLEDRLVATFTPESGTAFHDNTPTIVDDLIYVGTSTDMPEGLEPEAIINTLPENYFYKMDLDLNVIWKYSMGKTMVNGGATLDSDGNIYFVTIKHIAAGDKSKEEERAYFFAEQELVSLTNDGEFRWKRKISYNEQFGNVMINCGIDKKDIIYVGSGKLFAFNSNGDMLWQYPDNNNTITGYHSSPIIDSEGNVYFVSPEPTDRRGEHTSDIRAYKFGQDSNGIPIWSTLLDNNILENEGGNPNGGGGGRSAYVYSTPAFLTDENSFYAVVGNTINHVNTETGEILWSMIPTGATGRFTASPAVDENDTLYIGTKSNMESNLYAIRKDGTLLWMNHIGADLYNSPLLGDDNRLYIGSETNTDGKFY
ncbi:MAG: PQQ-binding-like beta-propeller repeat protein [Candidatus Thermoplasmatota archaeon]|nr:PQQ-binding-like beta-propeller repeat protein [Candidatus Thermoplasmatota archaeon]